MSALASRATFSMSGTVVTNASDVAIVHAIIGLAKNLKLAVIAEGVETEAQRAWLVAEGCDEMQGFYFGRPVPADRFAALLAAEAPIARSA